MLQDLDKTFEKLLIQEGKLSSGDIEVSFEQPTREWSGRLNRPTLNCFCFDVRENLKLRNMEMSTTPVNGNRGRTSFPARRMDLAYLVTAWARKIEDEHQLLWRALSVMKRFPNLQPDDCEGALRYQNLPIPLLVADPSGMGINLVDLWSVMDNQMRLGFTVIATVELDVQMGFEGPLVLEAFIRVGEADRPQKRKFSRQPEEIRIRPKPDDTTDTEDS
ncbi:MAG: DUF4255 domain-containing protein [Anaerolineae bacterium]|nr:DUF4255 domain-containing protein [Anaerolineae bacterium]